MSTPSLADLTYFANRSVGGIEDPNDPRTQAMLAALRQYDPNAHLVATQMGGEGGSGATTYTLNFDQSKLPGVDGTGQLGGATGPGITQFSTVQPHMHLANPSLTYNSPLYGEITPNSNVVQDDDWIGKWGGPLLVSMFAFGAPALAAAMSNGAIGGAAAASGAGAGAGGMDSGVGYDPWVEAGQSIPNTGAAASGLDGSLLPMMPTDPASLYTPMLPFNPADPSLAINGVTPAMAAGITTGGGALSDAPLQPMMPQDPSSLYTPMLPFNPADPSLALGPSLLTTLMHDAGKVISGLGSGATGGAGSGGGGGGGGLLHGAGGGGSPVEDATSILARYFGIMNLNPLLDPRTHK